ncbi:MAG TPA: delta-60 repeat domain-containing protein, partial [Opitutaceae bacterium]|nr:delta-60 repeat domain-containing protein [Opitutaceae bacterium]
FTSSDGSTTTTANYIARLNTDGSLDSTFTPGGDQSVSALAIQSDGKILAAGSFSTFYSSGATTATAHSCIVRINSTDGTVDTTFNAHTNAAITTLALQSDGKIVVGGGFTAAFGNNDTTTVLVRHFIARFNADGSLDAGFDPSANAPVVAVAVQPSDGKILFGGLFTTIQPNSATNWTQRNYLARVNTDGSLDASFDPNANQQVRALTVRTDSGYAGKILVAGGFTTLQPNGGAVTTLSLPIAQLNPDSTVDNGFVVSAGGPIGSKVNALAVQPNGRILVGGVFSTLAGSPSSNFARLNTDNSEDGFFLPTPDDAVNAVAVLSDNNGIASPVPGFAWLNPNGTLLPASRFQPNYVVQLKGHINTIVRQTATGQILLGGLFTNQSGATSGNLVRLNADGGLDIGFNPSPDGAVLAILVRTDTGHVGQIVVAGAFSNICGVARNHIAQLNSDGTLDASFDPDASSDVDVMLQQPDGKILIGGAFTSLTPNGATTATSIQYLARLNTDGTVDTAFNPTPDNQVSSLALQPADNKILVGGVFSNFSPNAATTATKRMSIARLNADGTLDPGFDPNGTGNVMSLIVQPDGKILMCGNFLTVGGWSRSGIARLQTSGNLDENFNPSANGQVNSMVLQADGSILVGGAFSGISNVTRARLARLNADGSLDLSFDPSPDDQVNVLSLQADGTVMIGGYFTAFRSNGTLLAGGAFNNIGGLPTKHLALLRDDGNVDATFQPNPDGTVNALLLQTDGSFVVGGDFTHIAGVARSRLARFLTNADGTHTLDTTFNAPAPLGAVTALTLQTDGKIIVGAPFSSGVPAYASLARLNTNGTLDTAFQPGLLGAITALAVQPDGRVLAANAPQASGVPTQPGRVVRLNPDGSRDTSFNAYANDVIATLALQTDGRIVIGGVFTAVNGVARNRLARLNADGTLDTTFDPNANASVNSLVIQPDGKVLVGGAFTLMSSQGRYLLARIGATAMATQSLTVSANHTTITWQRTGSGPELSGAVFDQSTDGGVTWTSLGKASRVSGTSNWQLGGLSLPSSLVYVRARGLVLTSQYGSAQVIELYWQFLLSSVSGTDYVGVAADLAGGTTTNGTTSSQTTSNVAFGSTLNASSVTDAGTGTQQSDAATTAGRLISLSARATVNNGYPLITGFVISGNGQKSVLLRAVGPGLSGLGVPAPLAAPRMQIYNGATLLYAINTGWDSSSNLMAVFNRLSALPLVAGSADAATLVTLSPGSYTVIVPDGQGSGTVLAEVYDADASTATGAVRFTGLSARAQVTVGDPLIAGLAISGNTARRVLLRGWGPALAKSGVAGVLNDPVLAVYDSQDQLLAQNDNWQTQTSVNSTQTLGSVNDVVSACVAVFDSGSKDSALIITLAPGTYTIQITGVNHTAGAAMAEAYDLSP